MSRRGSLNQGSTDVIDKSAKLDTRSRPHLTRFSSMESFKQVETRSSKQKKKFEFNSSRVSPIPSSTSQLGALNSSKSSNQIFASSKKFFSASVPGSRIVSRATSPTSIRPSPPRSTTPTPTLGGLTSPRIVVDDAKRTNESLSQEITKLRAQYLKKMAETLPVGPGRNIKSPKSVSSESSITSSDIPNGCIDQVHSQLTFQELESSVSNSQLLSNGSSNASNRSAIHNRQGYPEATTKNGARTKECDSRNENEWVEQDDPGVYITLTSLSGGVKDLKRVRFSRKRFSEKQAEKWWEENRASVYELYNGGIKGWHRRTRNYMFACKRAVNLVSEQFRTLASLRNYLAPPLAAALPPRLFSAGALRLMFHLDISYSFPIKFQPMLPTQQAQPYGSGSSQQFLPLGHANVAMSQPFQIQFPQPVQQVTSRPVVGMHSMPQGPPIPHDFQRNLPMSNNHMPGSGGPNLPLSSSYNQVNADSSGSQYQTQINDHRFPLGVVPLDANKLKVTGSLFFGFQEANYVVDPVETIQSDWIEHTSRKGKKNKSMPIWLSGILAFGLYSHRLLSSSEPASLAVANSEKIGIAVTLENSVAPPVSETTTAQDAVVYGNEFSSENRENAKKDAAITEIGGATPSYEKTVELGPLVYESKAEAKSTFKTLLESANIGSDCTGDQAMRAVINDRRYGALKSLCERKQAFNEDYKELSPSSRWSKAISIFEHDERFKAVERAKDREDFFEDYVEELEKKVKLLLQNFLEHAKALEEQKRNRVEYLEFLKSCDFIKEYIRDLESEEEEQRKLRMVYCLLDSGVKIKFMFGDFDLSLRKNRDKFRKLMEEHVAAGILNAKTNWRDYCIKIKDFAAYLAVSSNTSGSTAKDLFTDVMDDLEKQMLWMSWRNR
ncbi:hypothetical protein T459_34563 [Capsicum annuum]|uniref:Uncharacterized protein n=1 Tax=Capsicum annuum TaxID=4072 RepID=A0A2G2XVX1_CAPAN|nr:hypothetical protein T459_34563 [Capsicum annuum]